MAKIDSLSITVSRTFNLGNYESVRVEATASIDREDGDEAAGLREYAMEEVRALLAKARREFVPRKD